MSLLVILLTLVVVMLGCGSDLKKAAQLEKQGDLEAAVALYREILARSPDNREALAGLAVDLMLLKRFSEALPVQERLAALDPSDVQIRIELGFNYLNHQGRPRDATRVLGEAAALDPSARNLTYWAQALVAIGDQTKAEEVLRQAIEMDPTYRYSYQVLLGLLRSQGREAEAGALAKGAEEHGILLSE